MSFHNDIRLILQRVVGMQITFAGIRQYMPAGYQCGALADRSTSFNSSVEDDARLILQHIFAMESSLASIHKHFAFNSSAPVTWEPHNAHVLIPAAAAEIAQVPSLSPTNEKKCAFDNCPCLVDCSTSTNSFLHMITCTHAPSDTMTRCLLFLNHVIGFKRHPTIGGTIPHTSHLTPRTSHLTPQMFHASTAERNSLMWIERLEADLQGLYWHSG